MPRTRVDEAGVRIERDRHGVRAARRPDGDLLAGQETVVEFRQHRPAGGEVDVCGPIDPDVGVRGNQAAVGAIQHIEEAVLVGLDHHVSEPAINPYVGQHVLVGGVHVVDVIGGVLVVAGDLPGLRPHRDDARCIQAVQLAAGAGIPGRGVPCPPIDEVELRIVRAGPPRGRAAEPPRIAVHRPSLGTGLARRGNGVAAPQFLPRLRIPAVEEPPRRGLAA